MCWMLKGAQTIFGQRRRRGQPRQKKNSLCKKVPQYITMRKQTLLDPDLIVGLMSEHPSQGLG